MMTTPIAALLTALAAPTAAPGVFESTVPWLEGEPITVRGSEATLVLRAWDRDEIRVTEALGRPDDRVEIAFGAGVSLSLRSATAGAPVHGRVVVDLPAGAAVEVFSLTGPVELEGLGGEFDVETLSGRVTGRALEGAALRVHSLSGSVDVDARGVARLDLSTSSGRVRVRRAWAARGPVEARSDFGRVKVAGRAPLSPQLEPAFAR